ncbi:unnamed protein product, partial [Symbiodinium necroappetens]
EEAETDMELLTKEVEELGHCDMSRGTKRALLGGGGDFSAWTLKALPDIWQRLEARQCYVVAGGSSMVGRVAVWRSPCVQPSDIEVWEAVQWPGDLKAVPTNCIVCSVRGKGITALAGGDSDGDDVAVTLNQDLVEFVEHTEAAVAQLDWEQACKPKKELEVEARKLFSTTADRSPTYLQHMLNVPTPNVRGQATALAEKCQQAVMEAPGDMRLLMCMLQVGFLCHAAYDCPKKFSGKMVLAAIRQVMRAAGVAPTTHRSTWADAWLLASRGLPKATRKPWETVKLETLRDKTQPLGQ